ncbi:hypothetical protein EDD16DRAFT_1549779 [Pisolithus croceorrhizus]|nr:hypothetical protein EV401DRAFT_1947412 [Pisolithus croceorrhizus]KAI6128164.1 hypothetical protein EDD16DRAFT_1549779 [Pisolithus croceorrhizus]
MSRSSDHFYATFRASSSFLAVLLRWCISPQNTSALEVSPPSDNAPEGGVASTTAHHVQALCKIHRVEWSIISPSSRARKIGEWRWAPRTRMTRHLHSCRNPYQENLLVKFTECTCTIIETLFQPQYVGIRAGTYVCCEIFMKEVDGWRFDTGMTRPACRCQ